jgi:hypothetical protein
VALGAAAWCDEAASRPACRWSRSTDLSREVSCDDRSALDGRLVFGIGYGWNREEMASHGVDSQQRALVREKVLAIEALWANEAAEFRNELVSFEASWHRPKPVQRPRRRS